MENVQAKKKSFNSTLANLHTWKHRILLLLYQGGSLLKLLQLLGSLNAYLRGIGVEVVVRLQRML